MAATFDGGALVGGDHEAVAGLGDLGEAEHLHRRGRSGLLDLLAAVVDAAPRTRPQAGAGDQRVADAQGALLHEHGGHGAPADVELGLEHGADGPAVDVAAEVLELGDDLEVLEQVVDAEVLQGRDLAP